MRLLRCHRRYRQEQGGENAASTTEDLASQTINDRNRQGAGHSAEQASEEDRPGRISKRQQHQRVAGIVQLPGPEQRAQPHQRRHQIGVEVGVGEFGGSQGAGAKEVPDAGSHTNFIDVAIEIGITLLYPPHAHPQSDSQDAAQQDWEHPQTVHLAALEQAWRNIVHRILWPARTVPIKVPLILDLPMRLR